jgi:GTP-binding protein
MPKDSAPAAETLRHERAVAIVGRPNVGKSALFNRLIGRKISIVHDMPGVTRDRIAAECTSGAAPFTVIDTGGIGGNADTTFATQVRTEVDLAVEMADAILFVVDGLSGLTPVDEQLAADLRRTRKPIVLVVNKIDSQKHHHLDAEFAALGFDQMLAVSAEHGLGIGELVQQAEALLPAPLPRDPDAEQKTPLQIAIVGRPNVGKSSLINAVLQDRRTIVSDVSGTTRDAVDIPCVIDGGPFVLIDTAGIRARSKVSQSVEVFSVMRSEKSIERADLCVLVIDASQGVTAQDKKIAGLIQEARKPCVIAMNKWDLVRPGKSQRRETLEEKIAAIREELFFLDYAPAILLSALTGEHVGRLFREIKRVRRGAAERVGTGQFNRELSEWLSANPPPARSGKRFKILYGTQVENAPGAAIANPVFLFFVNDPGVLTDAYRRFLERRIRELHPFSGLPIQFRFRGREKRGRDRK